MMEPLRCDGREEVELEYVVQASGTRRDALDHRSSESRTSEQRWGAERRRWRQRVVPEPCAHLAKDAAKARASDGLGVQPRGRDGKSICERAGQATS